MKAGDGNKVHGAGTAQHLPLLCCQCLVGTNRETEDIRRSLPPCQRRRHPACKDRSRLAGATGRLLGWQATVFSALTYPAGGTDPFAEQPALIVEGTRIDRATRRPDADLQLPDLTRPDLRRGVIPGDQNSLRNPGCGTRQPCFKHEAQ